MLTSVETSVFAGCDLGISGLIMAFRCKGRCIWTRITGTDIGNDRGSTNFELTSYFILRTQYLEVRSPSQLLPWVACGTMAGGATRKRSSDF